MTARTAVMRASRRIHMSTQRMLSCVLACLLQATDHVLRTARTNLQWVSSMDSVCVRRFTYVGVSDQLPWQRLAQARRVTGRTACTVRARPLALVVDSAVLQTPKSVEGWLTVTVTKQRHHHTAQLHQMPCY
jgi:hypothetical protein